MSPFYLVGHWVGGFFNYQLLGFRIVNGFLIVLSTLGLGLAFKKTAKLAPWLTPITFITLSLLAIEHLAFIPTLSYNSLAYSGTALWLGAIYMMWDLDRPIPQLTVGILAGIGTLIASYGRPTTGLLLILTTVLALGLNYVIKKHSIAAFASSFITIVIGGALLSWWRFHNAFITIWQLIQVQATVSHQHWAMHTLLQIGGAGITFIALAWVLSTQYAKTSPRHIQILGAFIVISWINLLLLSALIYLKESLFTCLIAGVCTLIPSVFFLTHTKKSTISLITITYLAAIAISLGTNTGIIGHILTFSLAILAIPFLWALSESTTHYPEHKKTATLLIVLLWISIAMLTVHKLVTTHHRNAPLSHQTTQIPGENYLSHIYIDPQIAQLIGTLQTTLKDHNFNPKTDRLIAYPDMPGLIAPLQIQAYGSVWNATKYPHFEKAIEAYLALEPQNASIRYIYILKGQAFAPALVPIMDSYITPASATLTTTPIGRLYSYRNKETYAIVLEGPYIPRQRGPK